MRSIKIKLADPLIYTLDDEKSISKKVLVMIFKNFIKGLLGCFVFLTAGLNAQSQDLYSYLDPFDPSNIIKVDLSRKVIILGDIVEPAVICNEVDSFYCFNSQSVSFAVPAQNIELLTEWIFDGVRYENSGISTIKYLGKTVEMYRIVTDRDGAEYKFLYSLSHGLIAIGAFTKKTKQGRVYLLIGDNGFGKSMGADPDQSPRK